MAVIKRSKKDSIPDLVAALGDFMFQLEEQKEDAAVSDLRIAAGDLQRYVLGSAEFNAALDLVINCYDGEHELSAYTLRRKNADDGTWTAADALFLSSTRVLNLAQRFRH
jgi:hypothetical protein